MQKYWITFFWQTLLKVSLSNHECQFFLANVCTLWSVLKLFEWVLKKCYKFFSRIQLNHSLAANTILCFKITWIMLIWPELVDLTFCGFVMTHDMQIPLLPRPTARCVTTVFCWHGSKKRSDWLKKMSKLMSITPTRSLSFISKASWWFLRFGKPSKDSASCCRKMANSTENDELISSSLDSSSKRKAISEMRLRDPRLWDIVGW